MVDFPFQFCLKLNFDLKIIQDTGKLSSQLPSCCFTADREWAGWGAWDQRTGGGGSNLGLSSPDKINLTIRETPSAAGKTAGTRRFCFLGYREW